MLKLIRKRIKLFLWILVLAFILWGTGTFFTTRSAGPPYAGKLYGKPVPWERYQAALEGVTHQIKLTYGTAPELLPQLMKLLNIYDLAWERLILLREAQRRRTTIADEELAQFIRQHPLFRGSTGQFDQSLYLRAIQYGFETTPRRFEEELKKTLIIAKLTDAVAKETAVTVTEEGIREAYRQELAAKPTDTPESPERTEATQTAEPAPIDEAQFAQERPAIEERLKARKRQEYHLTWLAGLRAQARLDSRVEEVYGNTGQDQSK